MSALYERFWELPVEKALFGLEPRENVTEYFCYPEGARAIGGEGCILYCFLEGYGETVFACNPESCADRFVYPLAACFADFLKLILACGTVNPVEQIVWMDRTQFEAHLRRERSARTDAQKQALELLGNMPGIFAMDDPYSYVKNLQNAFDDSKIRFREEYYDILGLEPPEQEA